jgi:hypothetical protein
MITFEEDNLVNHEFRSEEVKQFLKKYAREVIIAEIKMNREKDMEESD